MKITKQNQITKEAYDKGYRVDKEGNIVSSQNTPELKLSRQNKRGKLYKSFNISFKGMSTRCYVHKLQAYQKFGEKMFKRGMVVRHMNDISLDNSWENIEIGTQMENIADRTANACSDCPF